MSGGSKTTTTQNQVTQPWSAAQPYLQDIMSQAQQLYQNGSSYAPFSTVAPMSPTTQMGLQLTQDRAINGNPLIGTADNSLSGLLQASGSNSPGSSTLASLMNGTSTMPGQGTLAAEANGQFLNSNPYLAQMFKYASAPVTDAVNAQFGLAGRTGSGAQADVLSRDLGGLAAQIYGQDYENQMGIMNNASQSLANQSFNAASSLNNNNYMTNAQQLQAAGLSPTLANQDYTDLQNLLSVGNAYDTQSQNQLNDLLSRYNYSQQQPWNLLQQYAGLTMPIGSMGSQGSGQSTQQQSTSMWPSLIGGALSLAGAAL